MIVKKSGGRIFGAVLTAAEQKTLDMEIDRQVDEIMVELVQEHRDAVTARVLWVLFHTLELSEEQLKQFADVLDDSLDELVNYYQMGEKDLTWLCQQKLKDAGIDYKSWGSKMAKMVLEK